MQIGKLPEFLGWMFGIIVAVIVIIIAICMLGSEVADIKEAYDQRDQEGSGSEKKGCIYACTLLSVLAILIIIGITYFR